MIGRLFSNKHRKANVLISIGVLLALCSYSGVSGLLAREIERQNLIVCLDSPNTCRMNNLMLVGTVVSISDGLIKFVAHLPSQPSWKSVRSRDQKVRLNWPLFGSGKFEEIPIGRGIAVVGNFNETGTFLIEKYRLGSATVQNIKYIVSIIGLCCAILLFKKRYRYSSSQKSIEKKV